MTPVKVPLRFIYYRIKSCLTFATIYFNPHARKFNKIQWYNTHVLCSYLQMNVVLWNLKRERHKVNTKIILMWHEVIFKFSIWSGTSSVMVACMHIIFSNSTDTFRGVRLGYFMLVPVQSINSKRDWSRSLHIMTRNSVSPYEPVRKKFYMNSSQFFIWLSVLISPMFRS